MTAEPVRLVVDSIGIDATITPIAMTSSLVLQVPDDPSDGAVGRQRQTGVRARAP